MESAGTVSLLTSKRKPRRQTAGLTVKMYFQTIAGAVITPTGPGILTNGQQVTSSIVGRAGAALFAISNYSPTLTTQGGQTFTTTQTIRNRQFTGKVIVTGGNVTFEFCIFSFAPPALSSAMQLYNGGAATGSIVCNWCDFDTGLRGASGNNETCGLQVGERVSAATIGQTSSFFVYRSRFEGFANLIGLHKFQCQPSVISECLMTSETTGGAAPANGIELYSSNNITVQRCRIMNGTSLNNQSCINIDTIDGQAFGSAQDVIIDNYINGGIAPVRTRAGNNVGYQRNFFGDSAYYGRECDFNSVDVTYNSAYAVANQSVIFWESTNVWAPDGESVTSPAVAPSGDATAGRPHAVNTFVDARNFFGGAGSLQWNGNRRDFSGSAWQGFTTAAFSGSQAANEILNLRPSVRLGGIGSQQASVSARIRALVSLQGVGSQRTSASEQVRALVSLQGAGSLSAHEGTAVADPIPLSRRTDWTYTGVPGGIPNRTSIFATFSPGATAAQITTALQSAGPEQVVFLNAGTYSSASLSGSISLETLKNVSLRGAGMGQTILQGASIIVKASGGGVTDNRAITGAVKGGFTCTVASTTNLGPGVMIEIDRDNDPTLIPSTFTPSNNGTAGGGTRTMTQVNMITNVTGNTVTVRNPWFADFSAGNPKIKFIYTTTGGGAPIVRVGVENLTLDHTGQAATTNLWYADSCWFQGVESHGGTGYHLVFLGNVNFEARRCYFHDGSSGPNNAGFNFFGNFNFGSGNSHWKVEDCIFNNLFPCIEVNNSSSAGYVGYCYVPGSNTGVSYTFDDCHAPLNCFNLYEGNDTDTLGADNYFGGSVMGNYCRNYTRGVNTNDNSKGDAIRLHRMAYFYNFVGNVIGSTAQNTSAYDIGCTISGSSGGIFELGYPNIGNCDLTDQSGTPWVAGPPGGYPDAMVKSTLLRWGNYDSFHASTQFNSAEIPSGVPIPSSQTIPNSYFYTSTPSWWPGGIPWPPIGPDVTGGNGDTTGHVNKIPARIRYETGPPF